MILNLTQHLATPEQIAAGVVDLPAPQRSELIEALTVNDLPTWAELAARAEFIAELACQNGLGGDEADDPHPQAAMIGGAGPLMRALLPALTARGISARESFSRRESVDAVQADGTVRKTATFRHVGWWPTESAE